MPTTFTLSLEHLAYILGVGFVIGVAVSTLLYLQLTSGIRIRPPQRHTWRDCDERYD